MLEALFFAIGFLIGGLFGVVMMCLLQINRIGREHEDE
ncbi:DUF3789 domain-containing protein [uncultured Gemmiger sp.]|nr:DUF3789 domain-containing protein [uncultured Gemmiger sp.]